MTTEVVNSDLAGFNWWSWLARQGAMTVFLGAFAYFLAFSIVIPMRDDQKAFMQSVIRTNETNAATHASAAAAMTQLSQVQTVQATTLTALADQQKQTTSILQQIRDDQRRGAWNDPKAGRE